MTYWKANAMTSQRIAAFLDDGQRALDAARIICKECGGKTVYVSRSFGWTYHTGFSFADGKVDSKRFVRLKGTSDGWRPRSRTELAKRLEETRSFYVGEIAKVIGMRILGPNMEIRTPGVHLVGRTVYLEVHDDVTPKGCKRISDLEYERATKGK